MKRKKYLNLLFLLSLVAAIGIISVACNKDVVDDTPASALEKVGELENAKGVIHYDIEIKRWYVCVINSDGNEDTRYNIMSELGTDFQKDNLQVRFSGEIRQWKERVDMPPITDYKVIFLSKIEVEQSN